MSQVTYEDFSKIEIRVGRIVKVEDFPKARKPAYKLWIDFGDFGVKQSSAQITTFYKSAELAGTLVTAVTNFPPKQIAGFFSEVLVLGAVLDNGDVVLLKPDFEAPLGTRVL